MKRLLCVDDSPDMLEILVDLLQSQFTIVGTLSSGASALEEATNFECQTSFSWTSIWAI